MTWPRAGRLQRRGHEQHGADRGDGGAGALALRAPFILRSSNRAPQGHPAAFRVRRLRCRGDWTIASFIEEANSESGSRGPTGKVVCGLWAVTDRGDADARAIGERLPASSWTTAAALTSEPDSEALREKLPLDFVDATDTFLTRLEASPTRRSARSSAGPSSTCSSAARRNWAASASSRGRSTRRDRVGVGARPGGGDQEPP